MTQIAPVKWAQTSDCLYLTILLTDVTNVNIKITDKKLLFTGTSSNINYRCDLEFVHDVVEEGSTWKVTSPSIQVCF
jgi:hypothetical protein